MLKIQPHAETFPFSASRPRPHAWLSHPMVGPYMYN